MRKLLVAALLSAGLALGAAIVPAAADTIPDCAHITDGSAAYHVYDTAFDPYTVNASLYLGPYSITPSCKDVTYTLYVRYTQNGNTKTVTQEVKGDGKSNSPAVTFALKDIVSSDFITDSAEKVHPTICVYATTKLKDSMGGAIADRSPDLGQASCTSGGITYDGWATVTAAASDGSPGTGGTFPG